MMQTDRHGNAMNKPPLGLKPRRIHDEERSADVKAAINRFMEHNKKIPIEWIEEYNELVKERD